MFHLPSESDEIRPVNKNVQSPIDRLIKLESRFNLARKLVSEITFDFGTVIGKMENPHPTPLSVMQEMVVDGHSFAAWGAARIIETPG